MYYTLHLTLAPYPNTLLLTHSNKQIPSLVKRAGKHADVLFGIYVPFFNVSVAVRLPLNYT